MHRLWGVRAAGLSALVLLVVLPGVACAQGSTLTVTGDAAFTDPPLIRGSSYPDSLVLDVHNDGTRLACLAVSFQAPAGVIVEADPSALDVAPGQSGSLRLTVAASGAASPGWSDGVMTLAPEDRPECDPVRTLVDMVFQVADPKELRGLVEGARVVQDDALLVVMDARVANVGNLTLRYDAFLRVLDDADGDILAAELAADVRVQAGQSMALEASVSADAPLSGATYEMTLLAAGTPHVLDRLWGVVEASTAGGADEVVLDPPTAVEVAPKVTPPMDPELAQTDSDPAAPSMEVLVGLAVLAVVVGAGSWILVRAVRQRRVITARIPPGSEPGTRPQQASRAGARAPGPDRDDGDDMDRQVPRHRARASADMPPLDDDSEGRESFGEVPYAGDLELEDADFDEDAEDLDWEEGEQPSAYRGEHPAATPPSAAPPRPEARVVNVSFGRPDEAEPLGNIALEPGQRYDLVVDIGPLLDSSIVHDAGAHPFPSERLPERAGGHALQILAASNEFQVDSSLHRYFLPATGRGWACSCSGADECRGHDAPAAARIPLVAPRRPGRAQLRLAVYYRRNVVQSHAVTVQVGAGTDAGPAQEAMVDYSLSHDLADLDGLPEQTVSILTNDTDGTHRVVVNGADQEVAVMQLTEAQVATAIDRARQRLFAVHIDGDPSADPGTWADLLALDNSKSGAAFARDLEELALLGVDLWMALDQNAGLDGLQRLLAGAPARLQVARTRSSTLHFPWALVYDIPLDAQFGPLVPCPTAEAIASGQGLVVRCPAAAGGAGSHHPPNTLCPMGFWGLRHAIEQPPHLPGDRTTCLEIRAGSRGPCLVAGTSQALGDPQLTRRHVDELVQILPGFRVERFDQFHDLARRIGEDCVEVLYCYGHGGANGQPYLDVGAGGHLTPRALDFLRRTSADGLLWRHARPLVFMNACESAALKPGDLVNLVDAFMRANAAGVVGTEVPVSQRLAAEVATTFMDSFARTDAGTAMENARRRLVGKGNLMGLAYTMHGSNALRLRGPPT